PIMLAAVGHGLFYRLDPGLWPPELLFQHSRAGAALYNQRDKAKARRLLKEAGYTGQPVRWLTTHELEHFHCGGFAVVAGVGFEPTTFDGMKALRLRTR